MSAEGVMKSALLLMSIGEEEAAQVFKFLGPREVQKIGVAMAAMKASDIVLTMISDDNFSILQRKVLLQFTVLSE